jgi:hypothetical protein
MQRNVEVGLFTKLSLLTGPSKILFGLFAEHHLVNFAGISLTESGFESNFKNLIIPEAAIFSKS